METVPKLMSMTGYGKAVLEHELVAIEVELKSVNGRFLDLVFKLPRAYVPLEGALRDLVAGRLSRGRVEVMVMRTPRRQEACRLEFNRALFDSIFQVCQGVAKELKCFDGEMKGELVREILLRRDVLTPADDTTDLVFEKGQLLSATAQALDALCEMRAVEGERLAGDIAERGKVLQALRSQAASLAQGAAPMLRARLLERVKKLAPEVILDEGRLAAETAFLADRVDVTEELVRLESHLAQIGAALASPPSGRKLEFLLQEVGREWNTIASKAQDAQVQRLAIEAKCEIEKIKEQALNLE